MSSIKSLFKQSELFACKLLFVYFIVETANIVVCDRIVCKVDYSSLTGFAAFYVFAKTANLPFIIKFGSFIGHNSL